MQESVGATACPQGSAMGDDESTAAARALPCWSELGEVTLVPTTDESLSADL